MSSVVRAFKEAVPVSKRFTVFPYFGIPPSPSHPSTEYYFTVEDHKLQRIEADLSGNLQWIVARDMGKEERITDIDIEIKEWWENQNGWFNISVIRPGTARKFQALSIPTGFTGDFDNLNSTPSLYGNPAFNAGAYTSYSKNIADLSGGIVVDLSGTQSIPYFNSLNNSEGINDLMQMGYGETTISNNYNKNLPFATFWAVTDPVIIKYDWSDATYTRAIVNRVTPC
jgi:hypothetical protein